MIPTLLTITFVFVIAFVVAPLINIDGIYEIVSSSIFYRNNFISYSIIPSSIAI